MTLNHGSGHIVNKTWIGNLCRQVGYRLKNFDQFLGDYIIPKATPTTNKVTTTTTSDLCYFCNFVEVEVVTMNRDRESIPTRYGAFL